MTRPEMRRRRLGFTLVELLVVIVIIGILAALLLPVIAASVRKANDARCSGEIQTLAAALANFKTKYGEYPPSRVILSETGVYSTAAAVIPGVVTTPVPADYTTSLGLVTTWYGNTNTTFSNNDISFGELASRSLRALRRFFPRARLVPQDLNGDNKFDATNDYWPDFNGNAGVNGNNAPDSGFIYLEGHECLVFFLGGIPTPAAGANGVVGYGVSGFAKDPVYPFKNAGVLSVPISTVNRDPAFFEFRGDRLRDDDSDGIPGYLDPYASGNDGRYYAYFAAYGAGGYDPNDTNSTEKDDSGTVISGTEFRVGLPLIPAPSVPNTTYSPTPNPYTSSLPTPVDYKSNPPVFDLTQPTSYLNGNSFQIISAGGNLLFGPGGQYVSGSDSLPTPPGPPYSAQSRLREREEDNIGNFSSGRLK